MIIVKSFYIVHSLPEKYKPNLIFITFFNRKLQTSSFYFLCPSLKTKIGTYHFHNNIETSILIGIRRCNTLPYFCLKCPVFINYVGMYQPAGTRTCDLRLASLTSCRPDNLNNPNDVLSRLSSESKLP